MDAYTDEQHQCFHQNKLLIFEHQYKGQYNDHMMVDYIYGLLHESDLKHICKFKKEINKAHMEIFCGHF